MWYYIETLNTLKLVLYFEVVCCHKDPAP